jgi:hypothetical protein
MADEWIEYPSAEIAALLAAVLKNQAVIMRTLARSPATPIALADRLDALAAQAELLVTQITSSPRSS